MFLLVTDLHASAHHLAIAIKKHITSPSYLSKAAPLSSLETPLNIIQDSSQCAKFEE